MASIFSRIIAREIPAYIIAENDLYIAFLDAFPTTRGHTLVIPKTETDYIFDLDDETYAGLMAFAKEIAGAIEKAVPCKRIGLAVVGLEVPHVHVHLIPLNSMSDMDFSNKLKLSAEEQAGIAESIRKNLL
ncbi:MAG: HIT family hydrolase [Cytophagaceae bacterium SCN 52-12]|nr:MAG: HIT family hydrolase [Cytophagaceae bacterium SCN 52-12]